MVFGFSSSAEVHVYITCVLLGVSDLMPLNCLMSAPAYIVEYYKYASGNPDATPNSVTLWANILSFYNLVSYVVQLVSGPTVLTSLGRRFSLRTRFVFALSLMMAEVLVIMLLPLAKVSQTCAVVVFLLVGAVAGVGKSYLEATNYALVGPMHPKFMSAVMFGCGFSGFVTSVMQCITKASMEDSYEGVLLQSRIYFSLSLGILLITLLLALSLRYNSYVQKYISEFRVQKAELSPDKGDEEGCHNGGGEREPDSSGAVVTGVASPSGKECSSGPAAAVSLSSAVAVAPMEEEDDGGEDMSLNAAHQFRNTSVWPILRIIYPYQITVFLVLFLSLLIFPSFVLPIDRESVWFGTIAVLVYNTGDAIGRWGSSLSFLWPSHKVLLGVSVSRFLFLPLIFLCIYGYIPGHAPPYVIMGLLGLTNGFFGAISMVYGSCDKKLTTKGERMMAGQLMGIALLTGGSCASLVALVVAIFLPQ